MGINTSALTGQRQPTTKTRLNTSSLTGFGFPPFKRQPVGPFEIETEKARRLLRREKPQPIFTPAIGKKKPFEIKIDVKDPSIQRLIEAQRKENLRDKTLLQKFSEVFDFKAPLKIILSKEEDSKVARLILEKKVKEGKITKDEMLKLSIGIDIDKELDNELKFALNIKKREADIIEGGAFAAVGAIENVGANVLKRISKRLGRRLTKIETEAVEQTLKNFASKGAKLVGITPEDKLVFNLKGVIKDKKITAENLADDISKAIKETLPGVTPSKVKTPIDTSALGGVKPVIKPVVEEGEIVNIFDTRKQIDKSIYNDLNKLFREAQEGLDIDVDVMTDLPKNINGAKAIGEITKLTAGEESFDVMQKIGNVLSKHGFDDIKTFEEAPEISEQFVDGKKLPTPLIDTEVIETFLKSQRKQQIAEPREVDLAEQAKKFKTAEEFVEAQPKFFHGTATEFDELAFGKGVRSGAFGAKDVESKAIFFSQGKETGDFFAKNRASFLKEEKGIVGKPRTIEVALDLKNPADFTTVEKADAVFEKAGLSADELLSGLEDIGSKVENAIARGDAELSDLFRVLDDADAIAKLKKAGFDGAIIQEPKDFGKSFAVFSPEQVKTKQQLTDIFNKAKQTEIEKIEIAEEIKSGDAISEFEKSLQEDILREERQAIQPKEFKGNLESQYQDFVGIIKDLKKFHKLREQISAGDDITFKRIAKEKGLLDPARQDIFHSQEEGITDDDIFIRFRDRLLEEDPALLITKRVVEELRIKKELEQLSPVEKQAYLLERGKVIRENARRKGLVRNVRELFNLTDDDMKKVSRRDILLMEEYEFRQYLNDIEAKASQFAETKQAKIELMTQIEDKNLKNWDNLRQKMKLPPVSKMNLKQLREFDDALRPYEYDDVFFSVRKLETVDKTDLKGVKTIREAKERLAKEINKPLSEVDKIEVGPLDRYRWETTLAEQNPFFKMIVDQKNKQFLIAEANALKFENEINPLIIKARKSKKRKLIDRLVPTDEKIFEYIGSHDKEGLAKEMTKEELDTANYLIPKFEEARQYLIKMEVLKTGRENYITNVRRGFLESVKEDGVVGAYKEILSQHKQDEATFNILDRETKEILPLEKFFQFSLRRTGDLIPTKNVAKAAITYFRILEKKKALDAMIPKLDIYVQALTPPKLTPKGLEYDRSLKKFFNEWVNTKKGRVAESLWKQGDKIDLVARAINSFITILDLGLNIPVGLASIVGEQVTTFVTLGKKDYSKGVARALTKQGRKIVKEYENFVGKSIWGELKEPAKNIGDKLSEGLFGLFNVASREADRINLLGSLTKEEFKAGKVSTERLAEMKRHAGRFRAIRGANSIVGATTLGKTITKYKTWAIPIFSTVSKDLLSLGKVVRGKQKINSQEMKELWRILEITAFVLIIGALTNKDDDQGFIGQLKAKMYREAMTIMGAMDTKMMLSTPRLISFISNLGTAISEIAKLEKYKTREGFKGVERFKRIFTPRAIKQFIPPDKKETEPKVDKELAEILGVKKQKKQKSLEDILLGAT